MTVSPPLDASDIAKVYSEARARYYEGKRVGRDNWADIEEEAHKYALIAVAASIIDRVAAKVRDAA